MSSSPRGATASKLVSRTSRSRAMRTRWRARSPRSMRAARRRLGGQPAAHAASSGRSPPRRDRSVAAQRAAVVAGEDARAVDQDPAAAEAGEERLGVAEADERRVVLDPRGAKLDGLRVVDLAVDLEARAAVAGLDVEADLAVTADDERRAAAAVVRDGRDDHPAAALREDRAAGGQRVGARPRRRRDDDPVAGVAHEHLAVDLDLDDDLAGALADDDDVVDRCAVEVAVPGHPQPGQA